MIVECNLFCIDSITQAEKWLPFIFDMSEVKACKQSTDNEDAFDFMKSCIYLGKKQSEYIIDVDYIAFKTMFREFHRSQFVKYINN